MSLKMSKTRKVYQAGYKPLTDTAPVHRHSTPVETTQTEPEFAYTLEFACQEPLFKQSVAPNLEMLLKSSSGQPAIKQWRQQAVKQTTHYACSIEVEEAKALQVGKHHVVPFQLDNVMPHPKDSVTIQEAFIPLRPAIQVGSQLGLPTEGFLYHFLDDKLLNEYRFGGNKKYRFVATQSVAGSMNSAPSNASETDFILALWKRNGQTVDNQYLLFSKEPLDDNAVALVDHAFLDEHGIQLDMGELIPLTEGQAKRKKHIVAPGETLDQVAEQQSITVEELKTLNPYWRGDDAQPEAGSVLYLEPVSQYNHGKDVGYQSNTALLIQDILSMGSISEQATFPVVRVAQSSQNSFAAIAPVRYAIDNIVPESLENEVAEGVHPIKDKQNFSGGVFVSDKVPYTLRQLRDGWLYTLHQPPEGDAWQLEEYQVREGEFYRCKGDDAAARLEAEPEAPQSHLMIRTECPYYLGYASQRWTDRIVAFYQSNEQARNDWLRDVNAGTHRTPIEQIETCVADVGQCDLTQFDWSCATTQLEEEDPTGLVAPLVSRNLKSYQYQVPSHAAHDLVALDDPMADIVDLYLRLSQSVQLTIEDDAARRQTVIAETIRSLVRISLPAESMSVIPPQDWIEVEQDIDTCLEYHYFQTQMTQANAPRGDAKAAIWAEAESTVLAYPQAKARLAAKGIAPALLEKRLDEYTQRRKAHRQVDWKGLDKYYKTYIETQALAQTGILRDVPILISALETLGNDPLRMGIDIAQHDHQITLNTLLDCILNDLDLSSQSCPELHERIDQLIIAPENLLGLTTSFFSSEIYAQTENLISQLDLSQFAENSRIPIGGFMSAFNDIIGFDDPNSPLFTMTKGLLVSLDTIIENAKKATAVKGDKALHAMQMLRFRILNRVMKLPGLAARRSMAMAVWAQLYLRGGKVQLNKLSHADRFGTNIYHHMSIEAGVLQKTLKTQMKGSPEYVKTSTELKDLNQRVSQFIDETPLVFEAYQDHQVGKHEFSSKAQNLSQKWDSVGRMDFVVSSLNLINVFNQMMSLQQIVESVPYPDTRRQELTLAYSTAWFINAVGSNLKGLSINNLKTETKLLDRSLKQIKASQSPTVAQTVHAEQYIARSLIAGVAGVIAVGLEGWQSIEDFYQSKDSAEKALLAVKTLALSTQGFSWITLAIRSLMSRYVGLAIGGVLQGWMLAANFWGAALYGVVTIILLLTEKTPLEKWLKHSVWGKEPDPALSAEDEFFNLITLINQPSVHTQVLSRNVMPLASPYDTTTQVEIEQRLTFTLPNTYAGDTIALGIEVKPAGKAAQPFGAQEIAAGQWRQDPNEPSTYSYQLVLPRPIRQTVSYHASTEPSKIRIFVLKDMDNPYQTNSDTTRSSIYQTQFAAGVNVTQEMVKLDAINLSQHTIIEVEVPR